MAEEKIYHPEEIVDQPLPNSEASGYASNISSSNIFTPQTIKDTPLPQKIVAKELISASLNTKSRTITQAYQFFQSGALQIGTHVYGISGDLRISQDGLVARNSKGEITVAIDGNSGDGVFKGDIQAGSVFTGVVSVGPDNRVLIDGEEGRILVKGETGVVQVLIGPLPEL